MIILLFSMNWSQYGKTFGKGFKSSFSDQNKSKFFSNFSKNLYKNKYVNNFINSNLQFKRFTVSFLNTINYQTINYIYNYQSNTMKISSEGFNMLEAEKTQEDFSALLSKIQSLIKFSSISYMNEFILGLKGNIIL